MIKTHHEGQFCRTRVLGNFHCQGVLHLWTMGQVLVVFAAGLLCLQQAVLFVYFVDKRPKSTIVVMLRRSVTLTTLFKGRLRPKRLTST